MTVLLIPLPLIGWAFPRGIPMGLPAALSRCLPAALPHRKAVPGQAHRRADSMPAAVAIGLSKPLPWLYEFIVFSRRSRVSWPQASYTRSEGDLRYLFEGYALDPDCRELFRDSQPVALEPKVFDLLLYLIRNRERVISRDELVETVWEGRVVSDSALGTRINAARAALCDDGAQQRLIRTLPRKGLRFVGTVREEMRVAGAGTAQVSSGNSEKPSIAVLPFENLSGDPTQDYFSDGIVEDITTALSRSRAFFVVARNSSFTYKGVPVRSQRVAQELGVRYLLEGSVRQAGGRLRVTGQLIEAASGRHLWADRFDGDLSGIFELQDQIVSCVVGAIEPQLEKAEINRATQAATGDLAAYDLYLRGLASWNRWSKDENAKALQLFYSAIDKDREFSTPYGLAASCHLFAKANDWVATFDEREIARLVDRAADLGIDDPIALCWAGHVHAYFFEDLDRALVLIDRALELDENLAVAWQRRGWVCGYAGDSQGAIGSLQKAIRLNPLDPRVFLTQSAMGFAHFIAGRDDEAADWAARALRIKPNWPPALRVALVSNAMRGDVDEAERVRATYLEIDPRMRIPKICGFYPLRREMDRQRLIEGLRKAGVPA
jgi:TolB-like protein